MQYFGSSISDNIGETPEGYLICKNVCIGRTGVQEYLGQELGLNDKYDEKIKVYRLEEDVFEPEAMASFESKPATNNHPHELVTINNIDMYGKGHIQNVHREGDYLVADIIITDPNLISEVKNKVKREVSLGYNCFYEPYKDGYRQIGIRGNHAAVVDRGRAGSHVCIKDHKPEVRRNGMPKHKRVLAAMLKAYAKDATPEELAEATEVMGVKAEENKDEEEGLLAKIKGLLSSKQEDEEPTEKPLSVEERLAKIEEALAKLTAVEKEEGHEGLDEEPTEKEVIEEVEKDPTEDASEEITEDEEPVDTTDALVNSLRPVIAKIKNAADRKMVADALKSSLRSDTPKGKNGYSTILNAMKKSAAAKSTMDSADQANLGKEIAAKYNPHYRKGE